MIELSLSLTVDGVKTTITKIFDLSVSEETLKNEVSRIAQSITEQPNF